jgi:hypothetical protein
MKLEYPIGFPTDLQNVVETEKIRADKDFRLTEQTQTLCLTESPAPPGHRGGGNSALQNPTKRALSITSTVRQVLSSVGRHCVRFRCFPKQLDCLSIK